MLLNCLKLSLRNLMRNKTLSVIHVTGLGLGIAAFLFAIQTVKFEYSFDEFLENRDEIYDISLVGKWPDGKEFFAISAVPALYHRINAHLPEATYVTRYFEQAEREPYCVMTYTDKDGRQESHNELNARYVDEDFLKVFDFKLLQGNRQTALADASSVVITQSIARKYFGDDDALGKVLELITGGPETRQTKFTYQVSAVLEDVPSNSFLQFEVLLPFRNFEDHYIQDVKNIWAWPGFFTFIRTDQAQDLKQLQVKINQLVPAEVHEDVLKLTGSTFSFKVLRFADLHFLNSSWDSQLSVVSTGSRTYTLIIGLIGMAILIVASVNYVNLTTAKSLKRAKEVGIRKVIGATRYQLIRQFVLDALIVNLFGFLFGLTLLQLSRPLIQILSGYSLALTDWNGVEVLLCLVVLGGNTLISGTVPAYFLSRIEPAKVLKGLSIQSSGGGSLRKSLVVFQFVVSVGLIVFTYCVFQQVQHMRAKEKGFDSDQRIILNSVGTEDFDFSKFRSFKKSIQGHSKIINVTGALNTPGPYSMRGGATFCREEAPEERVFLSINSVDYDYVKAMGLTLAAGREFEEDKMTSEKVVVLNESAVRALGYSTSEEAINKIISFHWQVTDFQKLKVIGVVKDYNSGSPGAPIPLQIFMFANTAWPYGQYSFFIVHLAPGLNQETLAFLEQQWKKIFPQAPFQYSFQDEAFQKVFERDEKIQAVAGISTLVAIFIACMGLGGLVAFSTSQRVKEIGIRKTLGASAGRILMLLSRDFVRLIVLSIVISMPLVWYAVSEFLKNYEYRIEISTWMFVVPSLALLIIALSTISFQTIKAANANLVEALKHE